MTRILHISNTDIENDSRICKELRALKELPSVKLFVVGIPENSMNGHGELESAKYRKLSLVSRRLKFLPRAIRYFFELIEFTLKASMAAKAIMPGIVHCHDTFALPTGLIIKRFLGCQLVYDAHELESNKNAQNFILSYSTLIIEKICWRQIDILITVSGSICDWYMHKLGKKTSFLILNSPVISEVTNTELLEHSKGKYFHKKYQIPESDLIFVYLGYLGKGRGIDLCLNAFADGSINAHLVFIGSGPLMSAITEYADRVFNIHLHEAVPHDQVVPLVSNADYGLCLLENVSLSDFYSLPNKLFEYCFARLPVLASNFPEISLMVEKYSLGSCCNPDPASVRAALSLLIRSPPTSVSLDITPLSWETQAERLRSIYLNRLMTKSSI